MTVIRIPHLREPIVLIARLPYWVERVRSTLKPLVEIKGQRIPLLHRSAVTPVNEAVNIFRMEEYATRPRKVIISLISCQWSTAVLC